MRYGRTSMVSFLSKLLVSFSGFFGTVVLTRFLGKEQYGTYVVVISVLTWAAVAGNLGISSAVKKRVSENDGVDYVVPGAISQLVLYALVVAVLWVSRPILNDYMGIEATGIVIVLLLVYLAVGFVTSVLDGQHKVHVSSILQPLQKTVQSIAQVVLVLGGLGIIGAFVGYFVGAVSAILVGAYFVRTNLRVPSLDDFDRLRTYAQFSWFAHIRGRTFLSMDTIILAFFVTNSVVGGYKAAWNLASIFATFSIAIQRTLFPEMSALASQDGNEDEIRGLFRESLTYAGLLIIPGVVGSALLGDIILRVYGEGFASGYYVLVILGVARLLYAYQGQFVNTIDALDYPNLTFRINVVFVSVNLVLNVVLAAEFGWYGAATATTISAAVGTTLGFWYLSDLVEVPIPSREIANQLFAALLMAGVVLPGRLTLEDSLPIGVALAGVGAAVYFTTLLAISQKFRKTVDDNLPFQLPLFTVD
jgi:O-antigen/teichoic acid export membrane protein